MTRNAAAASGVGVGVVLAWFWNGYVLVNGWGPEMPAEVSAAIAVAASRLLDRFDDDATGKMR